MCGYQTMYKRIKKVLNICIVVQMRCNIIDKRYTIDDEFYYSIIRRNIKKYRILNKFTQQQLTDMTEISREYICDVENESRNKHITISLLGRIAEVLGVEIVMFF